MLANYTQEKNKSKFHNKPPLGLCCIVAPSHMKCCTSPKGPLTTSISVHHTLLSSPLLQALYPAILCLYTTNHSKHSLLHTGLLFRATPSVPGAQLLQEIVSGAALGRHFGIVRTHFGSLLLRRGHAHLTHH